MRSGLSAESGVPLGERERKSFPFPASIGIRCDSKMGSTVKRDELFGELRPKGAKTWGLQLRVRSASTSWSFGSSKWEKSWPDTRFGIRGPRLPLSERFRVQRS